MFKQGFFCGTLSAICCSPLINLQASKVHWKSSERPCKLYLAQILLLISFMGNFGRRKMKLNGWWKNKKVAVCLMGWFIMSLGASESEVIPSGKKVRVCSNQWLNIKSDWFFFFFKCQTDPNFNIKEQTLILGNKSKPFIRWLILFVLQNGLCSARAFPTVTGDRQSNQSLCCCLQEKGRGENKFSVWFKIIILNRVSGQVFYLKKKVLQTKLR